MKFGDIFKNSFLNNYANQEITFQYVVIAMLVCLLISILVCAIYYMKARKYFFSHEFAVSIIALSVITAAVILTIQSSIVVSLGMVGALSIVRFRTAIKNPLDLVFLFWSIAVGIICGTGLFYIAVALTLILGIVVLLSDDIPGLPKNKLLVIDMSYPYDSRRLGEIISGHAKWWNVKTESTSMSDVNLIIELRGIDEQSALIEEIRKMSGVRNVSILTQEGAVD